MLCRQGLKNENNCAKASLRLFVAAMFAVLTCCAEASYGDVQSEGSKANPGKSSEQNEKLIELFQRAENLKNQGAYAELASKLHSRRTLIEKAKAGTSEMLERWIKDKEIIKESDALVRQGKYAKAVDKVKRRWEQRRQDKRLDGDLGIALIRASLSAVVIEDRPVLSRKEMKPILDEIIERDPMQVEAAVIRAWMIDASSSEEHLRLESRPSIIERNQRLLPIRQSLLEDETAPEPQEVKSRKPPRGPRKQTGANAQKTEGGKDWPSSKAGVPEDLSRFVQSVTAYSLGISRKPVFNEMELCDDFFNRSLLLTDRSGTEFYFDKGRLWQRTLTSNGFQWRLLEKKQKGNRWDAYDLFVVRWAGKDVEAGPQKQLYNMLTSKALIRNGDLGRMGEYSLYIYDSSPVFRSHLDSLDMYVCNKNTVRLGWKKQTVTPVGDLMPPRERPLPTRAPKERRDEGRNPWERRTTAPMEKRDEVGGRRSGRESLIRPLIEKENEGKVLVFTARELARLTPISGFPTIAAAAADNIFDLVPIFGILDKTPGSVRIDFYQDDEGNRYLLDSRQQKIFFTDSYMLEMRTPGHEPGDAPEGVLIRPTWFSHFEKDLEHAAPIVKWARKLEPGPPELEALIADIEQYGHRRKSIDDLLFDAVFKKRAAIAISKRLRTRESEMVRQTHQENIRLARDYFISIPFGFDPRGRLFIYSSTGQSGKAGLRPGGKTMNSNSRRPTGVAQKVKANELVFLDEDGTHIERQFYLSEDLGKLEKDMIGDFITPSYDAVPNPLTARYLDDSDNRSKQWSLGTMLQKARTALKNGNLHIAATLYREMPDLNITFPEVSTLTAPSSDDIKNIADALQGAVLSGASKVQCKLEFASVLARMGHPKEAQEMGWGAKAYWELALIPIVKETERYAVSYGYKVPDSLSQAASQATKLLASIPATKTEVDGWPERSIVFKPSELTGITDSGKIDQELVSFYKSRPSLKEYLKAKKWLKEKHPKLSLRNPINEFEGWVFSWKPLVLSNSEIKTLTPFTENTGLCDQWNRVLYEVETRPGRYESARTCLLQAAYHERNAALKNAFESLDYLTHSINAIAMLWLATASESYIYGPVRFGVDFVNVTIDELNQFIQPRMLVKLPKSTVDNFLNPIFGIQETTLRLLKSDRYISERFFWFEYANLDDKISLNLDHR